jgi:hypothetical protein
MDELTRRQMLKVTGAAAATIAASLEDTIVVLRFNDLGHADRPASPSASSPSRTSARISSPASWS